MARDLKAQLEISANAEGVEAGVSKAKRSIASLGTEARKAGEEASKGLGGIGEGAAPATAKVDAATRNMIRSIERVTFATEAGSRTTSRYFELLAQQRGVDPQALRPYLDALDKANLKQAQSIPIVQNAGKQLNQYGQTAAQTANALRQVPAQLTDIFTGLQAGQAPLTVLLQQGGQLKDSFGGVVPAARALGGAVVGLINPVTLTAAAVIGLGVALNEAEQRSKSINQAIIFSGNAAGVTAGQVERMAEAVAKLGGSQGRATEVLAQLTATGQVGAASLESITAAAIKMERVGGKAAEEFVKDIAALGKDPVQAAIKLNEQYNFLTLATLEQVRALKDQGDAAGAAALAQKAYTDAALSRSKELEAHLSSTEKLWLGIKDAIGRAADTLIERFSPDTVESRMSKLQERLEALNRIPSLPGVGRGAAVEKDRVAIQNEIDMLQLTASAGQFAAKSMAEFNAQQKAGIEAEQAINRIREQSRSKQQQLNDELKKYRDSIEAVKKANPNSTLLDPAKIKADEAAIRERFRERTSSPRVSGVVGDDAATRMLQQLREAEALSREQLATDQKLTASERERAKFEQLIADLKEKKVLTADQKSLLAAQDTIKAQLDKNIAVEKEVVSRERATKELERQRRELERFTEAAAQIQASIQSANEGRREQFDERLAVFGRGSEAREQLQARLNIEREFRRRQEQLARATPKDLLGGELYQAEVRKIKEALDEALRDNEAYFARIKELQADGAAGARRAFEDYISASEDFAGQVEVILGNAFANTEDALVRFVQTGKLEIKSLLDSIAADVIRATVRNAIGSILKQTLGGFFGAGETAGTAANTAAVSASTAAFTAVTTAATAAATALAAVATASGTSSLSSVFDGEDLGSFASIFGGFFASGGTPPMGKVSVVGENGPEFFVPRGLGTIVPLDRAPQGQAQQPIIVHLTQQFAPDTNRQTIDQAAVTAGRALQRAAGRGSN